MKNLLLLAVFASGGFAVHKHIVAPDEEKSAPSRVTAVPSQTPITIPYTNGDDLLARLRTVPAGQKFQLQSIGEPQRQTISFRCGDHEAKAQHRKQNAEQNKILNAAINAEIKRISGVN